MHDHDDDDDDCDDGDDGDGDDEEEDEDDNAVDDDYNNSQRHSRANHFGGIRFCITTFGPSEAYIHSGSTDTSPAVSKCDVRVRDRTECDSDDGEGDDNAPHALSLDLVP